MSLIKDEMDIGDAFGENFINCSSSNSRARSTKNVFTDDDDQDSQDADSNAGSFTETVKNGKATLTDKQMFRLIKEYKLRPCLWQKDHEDNKSSTKKTYALDDIADILNTSTELVKERIRTLRVVFFQNLKKHKKIGLNSRRGAQYRPRWKFYDALSFLNTMENQNSDSNNTTVAVNHNNYSHKRSESPATVDPIVNVSMENEATNESAEAIEDDGHHHTSWRQNSRISIPNANFGDYVNLTLSQIDDEIILKRAKCQIQLVLSAAITGNAKKQLSTISLNSSKQVM